MQRTTFSKAEGCACSTQNNQDERERDGQVFVIFFLILEILVFMAYVTYRTLII